MKTLKKQTVWRTSNETAKILGVSKQRVNVLARQGRFGPNAYKKYAPELNYNGTWMIPFPNPYKQLPTGRPRKQTDYFIEF